MESSSKKDRPHLLGYLVILFFAAFLLLLLSYFMQQRHSDQQQQMIDGLQQNMSAMQTAQNAIELNKELRAENSSLRSTNEQLEEQLQTVSANAESQEKTIRALDYLWRIEREYFQGRYSSARALIQSFEAAGLEDYLPETAISDPDYRTPAQQYESIYNLLF